MALIKCPECGRGVSTATDSCPHCGFPIRKTSGSSQYAAFKQARANSSNWPKPKNINWIEPIKGKKRRTLLAWFYIMIVGIVAGLLGLFGIPMLIYIGFGIAEISLFFIVFGALYLKFITRKIDGYTCAVYKGFFVNSLYVESEKQEASINRHLYGIFPNEKQIWVRISIWDGSVKIGIGSESDEKQFI